MIRFAPCHHHDAVGPMAGIISPSMPVYVVRNATGTNRAYSNLNEGFGKVLRMGANGPEVIARLKWMRDVLAPALRAALGKLGPLELKPLIARALHMGDEAHNRNIAGTSLLIRRFAPALIRAGVDPEHAAAALEFMHGNDHFFSTSAWPPAVHDRCGPWRCGPQHGERHEPQRRRLRPAIIGHRPRVVHRAGPGADGLYFPGFSRADAGADMGDSAITETAGLGASPWRRRLRSSSSSAARRRRRSSTRAR